MDKKDKAVEQALLKRALGFDYEETVTDTEIENGRVVSVKVRKYKKHVPPDAQALRFWLINCLPEVWKEKQTDNGTDDDTLKKLDAMLAEVRRVANEENHD